MPALTYVGARRAAEAVAAGAERGVAPVCAVVDAGGELLYLWRPEEAQVASVGVATDKARTAAIYRRPSKDFEDQAVQRAGSALHLARAVPLQGGIPIVRRRAGGRRGRRQRRLISRRGPRARRARRDGPSPQPVARRPRGLRRESRGVTVLTQASRHDVAAHPSRARGAAARLSRRGHRPSDRRGRRLGGRTVALLRRACGGDRFRRGRPPRTWARACVPNRTYDVAPHAEGADYDDSTGGCSRRPRPSFASARAGCASTGTEST